MMKNIVRLSAISAFVLALAIPALAAEKKEITVHAAAIAKQSDQLKCLSAKTAALQLD